MGKFKALGADLADLEDAANDRILEARILAASGRSAAAIASGLYATEILLKVLICKRLDLPKLPAAFQIHELDELLLLAGLSRRIYGPELLTVRAHWNQILELSEDLNELRYTPDRNWSGRLSDFMVWLDDPRDGVISWLSNLK